MRTGSGSDSSRSRWTSAGTCSVKDGRGGRRGWTRAKRTFEMLGLSKDTRADAGPQRTRTTASSAGLLTSPLFADRKHLRANPSVASCPEAWVPVPAS
jgi:hypothetical protein